MGLRPETAPVNPALEFAALVGRRKGTILGVFVLVTAVVAVAAVRTPPVFEAVSSLLVRMGREYVYRPEVGRAETARTPSLSEIVNSEVEILASRDLAELVVVALGVEKLYPDLLALGLDQVVTREKAVLRFRQATSVRAVLESSVIKVAYEHQVPQVAADAVNLLVERFRDKHVEVFGEERSGGLEDQMKAQRAGLTHAEEALAEFKRANGVFDLDEQRRLLLGQRVRLEEELRDCELQLVETRVRVEHAAQAEPAAAPARAERTPSEGLLTGLGPEARALDPLAANRLIEAASLRLMELQLEASELMRDYGPENRKVQSVRADIELVQDYLRRARIRSGTSGEARRTALARELADLDRRIEHLDLQEKTLRRLERELTAAESALQILRERVAEARLAEELDREKRISVRVIEKAAPPVVASGLPRNLKIALGSFVGLLAGAALAVLQELFRAR
jgi:uncharacterized protein involved in exopolysaccharide biosynthesis